MELTVMLSKLKELQRSQFAYFHAMECLNFDAATCAPSASFEARGMTQAFLSQKNYELLVNDETKDLLEGLLSRSSELDPVTCRQVQLIKEDFDELTVIPMDEYTAFSRLVSDSGEKWRLAKLENNYALYEPYLKQIIEYIRRFASYKDGSKPAYDVMLDQFEKGMNMQTLDSFFSLLRSKLVPAIDKTRTQAPMPAFVGAFCPIENQRKLAYYLMDLMGVDRERCILSETEHPFTSGFHNHDVRITTHYYPNAFLSSMYSVIHESGHALYELGMDDQYQFTRLNGGASTGMHESQSRFFENLVGHHPAFLRFLSPKLHEFFPEALRGVSDEELIRGACYVQPSLIRTEADEVTYPLHIMVRYEIEKQLIGGSLTTKDLPQAWNQLYKEYLGVTVSTDTEGVLQDVHWSDGSFGYFPTYALGSAYASQFLHAMKKDLPFEELLKEGELKPIAAWLHDRIHVHAQRYTPGELLLRVTGENFQPSYYIDHLLQLT